MRKMNTADTPPMYSHAKLSIIQPETCEYVARARSPKMMVAATKRVMNPAAAPKIRGSD